MPIDVWNVHNFILPEQRGSWGLPADGNRLVQRCCWYSLSDTDYPTGNLADASTSALTPLGNDFKDYLDR